jgi:uncharacterized protein (TIGR00661 family)
MHDKTILVCPLDWGLGHATRCVPIVRQFLAEGHRVIIGADKNSKAFLQHEFPELKTITIPGYEVEYGKKGSSLKLFFESVKFYNFIKKEKQLLDELLQKHQIDMIVSDNRYGLYSNKVESIIITHQLFPKALIGERTAHKKIAQLLDNFDEVWIPDNEGENNLSGELSHLKPFEQKHEFIGPLSRFVQPTKTFEIEFDVCAIISGPEPQRTIFEELILQQIEKHQLKAVVVSGKPSSSISSTQHSTLLFNHLPTEQLQEYILKSKLVVCRSGYSSIMDLTVLGKKAILVPTPGQTEQEYLAEYHNTKEQFIVQQQNELNLKC